MSHADDAITASTDVLAVEVDRLSVGLNREGKTIIPVRDVTFTLARGETLCIIGESGCGKSVTLRALIGLLPANATIGGTVRMQGREVTHLPFEEMRGIRGARVGMIFQEPATALDPVYTIGQQIVETIMAHDDRALRAARSRALELLELVSIPNAERRLDAYPHELSGGMRQRAMIAIALACGPDVLLADEPTTALDVTVQMQVLFLLRGLQERLGMAMVFVTHDVSVAAEIADRIAVMYAGTIVEIGSAQQILVEPRHPYTLGLLASRAHRSNRGHHVPIIPGGPPDPAELPTGCAFHPRCSAADSKCMTVAPDDRPVDNGRRIRCWHPNSEAIPEIR
ncbi:MAG: ABC transporter ATP-binding protein [Burkholderiales bacterium]